MSGISAICLLGGGAVFAALGGLTGRGRTLWALLSAACTAAGVLAGLASGGTLEGLLPPVLAVCALSMAALLYGRGEGR